MERQRNKRERKKGRVTEKYEECYVNHVTRKTKATMVRRCNTKGFGGQLGYLWAVLCRFPPAKL